MSGSGVARRRLCVVTPLQYGGGAEYQIECLLDVLVMRSDFDLYYLARRTDSSVRQDHYRVVKIGSGSNLPKLGYTMNAVSLYRALKSIQPDVIYQRVACGFTGVCAYYARRNGARLVWHLASDDDVSRKSVFGDRNPLRRYLEKRSVEYAIRHATCIVAQTRGQSELMKANYARAADSIVPNFHPAPVEKIDKSGPITVVWVANLKPLKRPEAFVRMARALADLDQARFVMIGAPPDPGHGSWAANIMSAIESTPNLQYVGQRTQAEVNEVLSRAHLFVNTSTREGFPNTFIQSWMRGVPVISLSVDPDDVLERERLGAHARNENHMVDLLRELILDSAKRRTYVERCVSYASRAHSMQNADRLADLLHCNLASEAG